MFSDPTGGTHICTQDGTFELLDEMTSGLIRVHNLTGSRDLFTPCERSGYVTHLKCRDYASISVVATHYRAQNYKDLTISCSVHSVWSLNRTFHFYSASQDTLGHVTAFR